MSSKYSVGIDLGTTNCVVAYAELDAGGPAKLDILKIPQVVAPHEGEALSSLSSFLYVPEEQEVASAAYELPDYPSYPTVSGALARRLSADRPGRVISAAKSWLCHAGVDRCAAILPWEADSDVQKFSPVTASKLLLRQMADAWQSSFPDAPLQEQQVTLTVPASFDITARELTREAALGAGLPADFILLEEPQAAVYHWLEKTGDHWREQVAEGEQLLVCDVGGGTTDLSLMRVEQEQGDLVLRRQAVGRHLLVGGDNMDLALAHFVAEKFAQQGTRLDAWQSVALWHSCRQAKESLLAEDGSQTETISVLGRGSKLIGGTVSTQVSRDDVQQLLVEGFFPECEAGSRPEAAAPTGFQELGLPFETDSAITRHLSAFLADNPIDDDAQVHLLLNGGVFKADALRTRIYQVVGQLRSGTAPGQLGDVADLDHAVARGAAYYGWAKQQGGIRIRAGTARSYYVGIETAGLAVPGMPRPLQAVCVVPFGLEEGSDVQVPGREVGLVIGRPARFRFFAAADRKDDVPGTTLRNWSEQELIETSPLEVTLENVDEATEDSPADNFVPVRFSGRVSELGVLELWCQSTRDDRQWKLEFTVREEAEAAT